MSHRPTGFSRRTLLSGFMVAGGGALLRPACLEAAARLSGDDVDSRMAQVLSGMIGVDMHNHVYPAGTEPHPHFGPQPGGQKTGSAAPPPRKEEPPQGPALSMAEEIRASGLTAVCASYVLDFAQNDKPGDALANYLRWLTAVDGELAKGPMSRALSLKDLQAAHAHGRPAIVQSVEGAMFVEGRLERVEQVYRRGVRHLQLLHMKDDMLSPLGDVITSPAHLGGLTAFGAEVVKECNRLGILVDMAHASGETVLGALKVATQPLIVSHTGLDSQTGTNPKMAEMMKPHLISKERAKVVADAEGVVGVWTKLADSPKEFVENIKAMVDVIGVDHVGIGTDSDLLSARVGQGTNKSWPGMTGGFFNVVVGEMIAQGFTPAEIGKVGGGNFCRVFGKVTAGHTA